MALLAISSRATVTIPVAWVLASLLFVLGSWLIGEGLWIHAKAALAQYLLRQSWAETLKTQQTVKPWPWADTWPVGRLQVPQLGIDQIVLGNASGQSLAFGPSLIGPGPFPGDTNHILLSGHRDTHFIFLRDLRPGDRLFFQSIQGTWLTYEVNATGIIDIRVQTLIKHTSAGHLFLVTCYPFDALLPGGRLRYIVTAEQITESNQSHTAASTMAGGGSNGRGTMEADVSNFK